MHPDRRNTLCTHLWCGGINLGRASRGWVNLYKPASNIEGLGVAKDLLDECHNKASIQNAQYKQWMAQYHNRRVKGRPGRGLGAAKSRGYREAYAEALPSLGSTLQGAANYTPRHL